MTITVSNASPLILLSAIGRIDLLRELFQDVTIAMEVWEEVVVRGRGRPGSMEVPASPFIHVEVPGSKARESIETEFRLGRGEAATLALAEERKAGLVLIDDKQARSLARNMGLKVAGTVGVLELGHRRRQLPDLRAAYERLRAAPSRIAPDLLNRSLAQFGLKPLE